jgi:hypothetical protein
MQIIDNKEDTGVVISLDDHHFINCRYKNCTLVYGGGEYGLTNTKLENCQITLSGAAQRTATFLASIGALPQQLPGFVPKPPASPSGVQ